MATNTTLLERTVSPKRILFGVTIGAMMAFLDATMVNIALNDMQSALQTDLSMMSWVLNAYNLVFALALIPGGRLADQFGRKRLFLVGLLIFGAGSTMCAFAPSVTWLIAARAVQGGGGALLSSVGLAIISAAFPSGKERNIALGIWGGANGLAIAVGPLCGALLVQFLDWPWIFLVNLPLCGISLVLVLHFVQETMDDTASKQIDIIGLLLLSITLICLVLFMLGNTWLSIREIMLGGGALLGFVVFAILELRQEQPMVNLHLFVRRGFTIGILSMMAFAVALMGMFVIFVIYLRHLGNDPLLTAVFLLPTPLTSFFLSLFAGSVLRKIPEPLVTLGGMVLLAIGLFSLTTLFPPFTIWEIIWRGTITGAGMGLCFSSLPNLALREIPATQAGQASGVFSLAQQIGFTLGVAILTNMLPSASGHQDYAHTWIVAGWCAVAGGLVIFPLLIKQTLFSHGTRSLEYPLVHMTPNRMIERLLWPLGACPFTLSFPPSPFPCLSFEELFTNDMLYDEIFEHMVWPLFRLCLMQHAKGIIISGDHLYNALLLRNASSSDQQRSDDLWREILERYMALLAWVTGIPILQIHSTIHAQEEDEQQGDKLHRQRIWFVHTLGFEEVDQACLRTFVEQCITAVPLRRSRAFPKTVMQTWLRQQDKILLERMQGIQKKDKDENSPQAQVSLAR